MKSIAILQSNYIPWKGYFRLIDQVDEFVILDEVQFTKNDWRNRNRIKTRDGVQWITIPVRQEHLDQKISEIQVSDTRWPRKHWNSWAQNYGKARHFKDYAEQVESWYGEAGKLVHLSDINRLFIRNLCLIFGVETRLTSCEDYELSGDRVQRLINICLQSGANRYLSGPAARDYLDESRFAAQGIEVQWMDYSGFPQYDQLFAPFEHGVSMLDLLFNAGASVPEYFRKT